MKNECKQTRKKNNKGSSNFRTTPFGSGSGSGRKYNQKKNKQTGKKYIRYTCVTSEHQLTIIQGYCIHLHLYI